MGRRWRTRPITWKPWDPLRHSILQANPSLRSRGEPGLVASEDPELLWTFLSLCYAVCRLWSDGVLPCPTKHAQCLWFHLPSTCPVLPQCQFCSFLILIKFSMTFHLDNLDINSSCLEMGQQVTLLLGPTCPEGDKVQYRTFPPDTLPGTATARTTSGVL